MRDIIARQLFANAVGKLPHVSLRMLNTDEVYCVTNVRISAKGSFLDLTVHVWSLQTMRLEEEHLLVSPLICRFMPISGNQELSDEVRSKSAALYEKFAEILMEEC